MHLNFSQCTNGSQPTQGASSSQKLSCAFSGCRLDSLLDNRLDNPALSLQLSEEDPLRDSTNMMDALPCSQMYSQQYASQQLLRCGRDCRSKSGNTCTHLSYTISVVPRDYCVLICGAVVVQHPGFCDPSGAARRPSLAGAADTGGNLAASQALPAEHRRRDSMPVASSIGVLLIAVCIAQRICAQITF